MSNHMTASRLAREVTATGSFYFDRDSMKHSGDTMRNYYVPVRPVPVSTYDGTTVMCWALQRRRPVKMGLYKTAYFAVDDYRRVFGAD